MSTDNVVPFQRGLAGSETLLVPIDGSALALAAALKAVAYAKRLQARLLIFTSIPAYQYPVYVGSIPFEYPSEEDYERQCREIANRYLGVVAHAAAAAGVPASTLIEFNGGPAQAIIEAAKKNNCSMIFMGSHGRSGFSRAFLGSVALKTLTLSQIPVLVDRPSEVDIAHAEEMMQKGAVDP